MHAINKTNAQLKNLFVGWFFSSFDCVLVCLIVCLKKLLRVGYFKATFWWRIINLSYRIDINLLVNDC